MICSLIPVNQPALIIIIIIILINTNTIRVCTGRAIIPAAPSTTQRLSPLRPYLPTSSGAVQEGLGQVPASCGPRGEHCVPTSPGVGQLVEQRVRAVVRLPSAQHEYE